MDGLSPGEVARAIGVSESSVKRWVDQGEIASRKTLGGHRRIPASAVVRFLRAQGVRPARPALLGLPRLSTRAPDVTDEAVAALTAALEAGSEQEVRAEVLGWFVAGMSLAAICDRLLAPAFHRIGHDWQHGAIEVYREHRAVELATRLLHEIRATLPEPAQRAPRALTAALEDDPYTLPMLMCALVLREIGWRDEPLGPNQPVAPLGAALAEMSPRLLCINLSHIEDRERLVADYGALHTAARARRVAVAVGGQALDADLRARLRCTAFCASMGELVGLAETLAHVS